jgi:hypothetical protein
MTDWNAPMTDAEVEATGLVQDERGNWHRPSGNGQFDVGGALPLHTWRIDWPTFWETDHREESWIVEPVLAEGRSHSIDSKPEGGKSRLLQEFAFALATGRPVLRRQASEPLTVVYLDMEMTEDDLHERATDFGYGPEDDLSRLHYILLPSIPPLDTAEGGKVLRDYVAVVGADVVFIDTTARVLEGPENDADTLRDFHRHTGQPLKAAGVTWARADHLGKDETRGARGTSAKSDDVDIVWQLTKGDGSVDLRAKKRRVRWVPERVALAVVDEPFLHHKPADRHWPAGTIEAAKKLDEAAVPLGATRREAREALKGAALSVANDALTSALRWRREHPEQMEIP